nr:ATP-binding cassette domain-containing protein [Aureimonas fodinaquatilis]
MNVLAADQLRKAYHTGKPVLDAASLTIASGESVALLGRSGSGKSTMARLLSGLEKPVAGSVLFNGKSLSHFSKPDWRQFRQAVQMVFQDPQSAVNPRHLVKDIISEPLRHLCAMPHKDQMSRVDELLHGVGLDACDAEKLPHQLSGGQLQRVCIARALAPQPRLIILDEATSNLDLKHQLQIFELFGHFQKGLGVSFLLITHDLRLVNRFCQRLVVLHNGAVVEEAPTGPSLHLKSAEGRALQDAVLPPLPA